MDALIALFFIALLTSPIWLGVYILYRISIRVTAKGIARGIRDAAKK